MLWPARRSSWAPPRERRGTPSPSSTRCGRCSPTCAPSSHRPPSSPLPRTGPAGAGPPARRPWSASLRAVVAPPAVFAAAEDWAGGDGPTGALAERIRRAAGELADLVSGRPPAAPSDPFEGPFGGTPPFEELLRGH